MKEDIFIKTNPQKILRFLAQRTDEFFLEQEIAHATGVSRGGANHALHLLAEEGLVDFTKRGKIRLYSANVIDPVVRQYKMLANLLEIAPLVEELQPISKKIIVFGSYAQGTNTGNSDIDVFVLTGQPREVMRIVGNHALGEKVQIVAKTPIEYAGMKKKERAFCEEIDQGITLWEHHYES